MDWLKKKNELTELKKQYSGMMRRSYELALTNKKASDRINREAEELLKKIKFVEATKFALGKDN